MTQGCGTGTLTRVLLLILLQNACFSMSWKNADLALRMWVLCFIAINENWLKRIDSSLGNPMQEWSGRIFFFFLMQFDMSATNCSDSDTTLFHFFAKTL